MHRHVHRFSDAAVRPSRGKIRMDSQKTSALHFFGPTWVGRSGGHHVVIDGLLQGHDYPHRKVVCVFRVIVTGDFAKA
jgi:hypothetical protein